MTLFWLLLLFMKLRSRAKVELGEAPVKFDCKLFYDGCNLLRALMLVLFNFFWHSILDKRFDLFLFFFPLEPYWHQWPEFPPEVSSVWKKIGDMGMQYRHGCNRCFSFPLLCIKTFAVNVLLYCKWVPPYEWKDA